MQLRKKSTWKMIAYRLCGVLGFAVAIPMASAKPVTPENAEALTNNQGNANHFAFVAVQGFGKNSHSAIITTRLDGGQPVVRYQTEGTILNLNSSYDGKTLVFTQQNGSYPLIYALDISANTLTLLTPYRANNISGTLSRDNKRLLFSSDLTADANNVDIYLKDLTNNRLTRITTDPMIDITPVWAADGQSFIFTSDRTGKNHPQIYRYYFANQRTEPLTFTGYHVNGNLSQDAQFLTLLNGQNLGALRSLTTGIMYPINNAGLNEAPTVTNDGQKLVYSTGQKLAVVKVQDLPKLKPQIIDLPLGAIQQALPKTSDNQQKMRIRHPVWLTL